MLTCYQWADGVGLREVPTPGPGCWLDLTEPTPEDIARVQAVVTFPREFLDDPLDKDERPRVEVDGDTGTVLIVLRVPFLDVASERAQFVTMPLGIVLAPQAVVTVCTRSTPVTSEIAERMRRLCSPENRHRFVLQIMLHAALLYLRNLRVLRERADAIENELHRSLHNEALIRLLDLEKSLVYFTTSLKANEIVIGRLSHLRRLNLTEEDTELLDDVSVEFRQALEMATIHSNILTGMMDAYASVISNNLNVVMKVLTSTTIVLMLPTLVASIYGMNVRLPLQGHPHAFAIVMSVSFGLSLATLAFFFRRRLF